MATKMKNAADPLDKWSESSDAPANPPSPPSTAQPKSREEIELEQELEGFVDLQPDRADGWFQPTPGAAIIGRLLGRFEMARVARKKVRAFYQIKVKKAWSPKSDRNPNGEVFMVSGKGDESVTLPVTKGTILAMDERKALELMAPYAEAVQVNGGVFDVFILHKEKIDIAGGEQSFWRCNVRVKQLKAPSHPVRLRARAASDEDDEIPF